eukprot:m.461478 g.461478  ORF g.461478 m.461478 type:complete len:258 (-) comp22317_c0_seq1:26-799(-)
MTIGEALGLVVWSTGCLVGGCVVDGGLEIASCVGGRVGTCVMPTVGAPVGASDVDGAREIGAPGVGVGVGFRVGFLDGGRGVGDKVSGDLVGSLVGERVDSRDGGGVTGDRVGTRVVGTRVGARVGSLVGERVGSRDGGGATGRLVGTRVGDRDVEPGQQVDVQMIIWPPNSTPHTPGGWNWAAILHSSDLSLVGTEKQPKPRCTQTNARSACTNQECVICSHRPQRLGSRDVPTLNTAPAYSTGVPVHAPTAHLAC